MSLADRRGAEPVTCPSSATALVATVAGFVLAHLRRLPAAGEQVEVSGWRFEVVDLDGRRVDKVLASRVPVTRR